MCVEAQILSGIQAKKGATGQAFSVTGASFCCQEPSRGRKQPQRGCHAGVNARNVSPWPPTLVHVPTLPTTLLTLPYALFVKEAPLVLSGTARSACGGCLNSSAQQMCRDEFPEVTIPRVESPASLQPPRQYIPITSKGCFRSRKLTFVDQGR